MKRKILSFFVLVSFISLNFFTPKLVNSKEEPIGKVIGTFGNKGWISVGKDKKLKEGDKLYVKREGNIVAIIKLIKVSENSSVFVIEKGSIKLEDEIFLKEIPKKKEVKKEEKKQKKEIEEAEKGREKKEIKTVETKKSKEVETKKTKEIEEIKIKEEGKFFKIGILDFYNKTNYKKLNLESKFLENLYLNSASYKKYRFLDKDNIKNILKKYNLTLEGASDNTIFSVGKLLKVDFLIEVEISNLSVDKSFAFISGNYKLFLISDKKVLSSSFYGTSGEKIGYKGKKENLIFEALNNVSLNFLFSLPGNVILIEKDKVYIDIGKKSNLKNGDVMEVIRGGIKIGEIKLKEVNDEKSMGEFIPKELGEKVLVGDLVRQKLTEEIKTISKVKKPRRKKNKLFLITVGILAAGSLAFLLPKKKEEDKGSLSISSFPPNAKIYIDGNDTGKTTPATLNDINVGNHTILLKSPNSLFSDATLSVVIERDKTTTIAENEAILPSASGSEGNFPPAPW